MNMFENKSINSLHERMLELLVEFERICEKNHLEYFAVGGTLLGTIRHNGFIPWDDDIDVGMKRKDYEIFLEIAPKELGSSFFLQTISTDFGSTTYHAKIRLNHTLFVERYARHAKMHQGIFLDIIPLDVIPVNEREAKQFCRKCFALRQLYVAKNLWGTMHPVNSFKSFMHMTMRAVMHIVLLPVPKRYLYEKLDRLLKTYENEKTRKYALPGAWNERVYILENEIHPVLEHAFETTTIYIPNQYDVFLKRHFGDYMKLPPENERYAHSPYRLKC